MKALRRFFQDPVVYLMIAGFLMLLSAGVMFVLMLGQMLLGPYLGTIIVCVVIALIFAALEWLADW